MRFAILAIAASMITATTQANAAHDLQEAACGYRDAVCSFHDVLHHDRYASRYVLTYSDRLHHAADELHDLVLQDPYCPRVQVAFDEVRGLHSRLASLVAHASRTNRGLYAVWSDVEYAMQRLRHTMHHVSHHSGHYYGTSTPIITARPIVTRRVEIASPLTTQSNVYGRGTVRIGVQSGRPTLDNHHNNPYVERDEYQLDRQRRERGSHSTTNRNDVLGRLLTNILN